MIERTEGHPKGCVLSPWKGREMRLWSVHPCYLDRKGLCGLWCEGLLALAVLQDKTKGYKNHPQLQRFKETNNPIAYLTEYLYWTAIEMQHRGYQPDVNRLPPRHLDIGLIPLTTGQLAYEVEHLQAKRHKRGTLPLDEELTVLCTHPIFKLIEGGVEQWERM